MSSENSQNIGDQSLKNPRLFHLALPGFSLILGDTTSWILFSTTPSSILNHPQPLGVTILPTANCWSFAAAELASGAIVARGRSLPAPLDPEWPKLSDLSFPASIAWIQVTLTGEGNSVISQFEGNFSISDPIEILVIFEIEDWL